MLLLPRIFTFPLPNPWLVGIVAFLAEVGMLRAEWSPQVVRGIQYLTSDAALLPFVRRHGLVAGWEVADETMAVARLRAMIDITQSADGKSLEVGVFSGDASLDGMLTDDVAESGRGMPDAERQLSSDELQEELAAQQDRVASARSEVLRIMREQGVMDLSWMREEEDGEDEIAEISSEPAAVDEWRTVQEARRRELAVFRQAVAEAEQREAEEKRRTDGVVPDSLVQAAALQAPFPPEFERSRRVHKQQLAVLNHLRFRRIEALHREARKSEPQEFSAVSSFSKRKGSKGLKVVPMASKTVGSGQKGVAVSAGSWPWQSHSLILLFILLAGGGLFYCWRRRNSGRQRGRGVMGP